RGRACAPSARDSAPAARNRKRRPRTTRQRRGPMSDAVSQPGADGPGPGRRRVPVAGLLLLGAAALAGAGWYGWRWYTAPPPPAVDTEGMDPDLARAVEEARQGVKKSPYSAAAWGHLGKLLRGADLGGDAAACF